MDVTMVGDWVSLADAARAWGVSTKTLRRRVRRDRARARESDADFLASASAMAPPATAAAATLNRALEHSVPEQELPSVAAAIAVVEQSLSHRPTLPPR